MDDFGSRIVEEGRQGLLCSQILLRLGLEAQGKDNPDLVRAVHALAGGLGFTGAACGALTGGTCLLGLYSGRGSPDEPEDGRLMFMVGDLVEWFEQEYGQLYGSHNCRDITSGDPLGHQSRCLGIIAATYEKAQALLTSYGFALDGSDR